MKDPFREEVYSSCIYRYQNTSIFTMSIRIMEIDFRLLGARQLTLASLLLCFKRRLCHGCPVVTTTEMISMEKFKESIWVMDAKLASEEQPQVA